MSDTKKTWTDENLKNPHVVEDKAERVQAMFSDIAGRYDLLNHLLSFNMDKGWRKKAVRWAQVKPGQAVLDLCCGTGDLAFTFAEAEEGLAEVTGLDFTANMLEIAREKQAEKNKQNQRKPLDIKWIQGDAQDTGLEGGHYDVVSCAFGVRNLQDLEKGIREVYRLLKPGGKMVVLEFVPPENRFFAWLTGLHFKLVLPKIGGMISKDKHDAYQYLPDSVKSFKTIDELRELVLGCGFEGVEIKKLCFGSVAGIIGMKK